MSIKKLFLSIFSISIFLLIGLAVLIFKLYETQQLLGSSQELRYQSYLAAQELRQSSDDLTKFARTYVVTGDSKYETMYWDILAIRNGDKPRPERYEHIYWDFVAHTNEKPRPDGQAVALKQRMKDLGFTEAEFAKLAEAENNSNALVKTETIAMNAVKGLFDDGKGNFTNKGTPDLELARKLMHDSDYHKHKFNIMKPIDDFFVQVSDRTRLAVQQYTALTHRYLALIGIAIFGIIILSLFFYFLLMRNLMQQLGGEPAMVAEIAQKIGSGDLSSTLFRTDQPLTGLLSNMREMQNQLRQRFEEDQRITQDLQERFTTDKRVTAELQAVIEAASQGDFSKRLHLEDKTGTFKMLADSINQVFEFNQLVITDLMQVFAAVAQGDLTKTITNDYSGELARLKQDANATVQKLTEVTTELTAVARVASQGNFSQRLQLDNKTGTFKIIAGSINQVLEFNQLVIIDLMRVFAAVAQGDLTTTVTHDYAGELAQLKQDANTTVQKLTEVLSVIRQTVAIVSHAAGEISQGNLDLSQRTTEQAAALQETAASMEQMTGTVQQNAENAKQANQLAVSARGRAEQGNQVVKDAVLAINEISKSSKKIADIISVIDEIAFQTNLLALNAAVEAARAGEQGRGFAVVATEVRNLAQRSAAAAKEIKALIQDSNAKVEEGTRLASQSGQSLEEIVVAVKKVSDIVAEIAAASIEQSVGIGQVNKSISQMDAMVEQNSALVEQAAAASEAMKEQVQALRQQVAFFSMGEEETKEMVPAPLVKNVPKSGYSVLPAKRTVKKRETEVAPQKREWEDF